MNEGGERSAVGTQYQRCADHTFATDETDLDAAILGVGEMRAQAALDIVGMFDRLMRVDQRLVQAQRYALQRRAETYEVVRLERGEETVTDLRLLELEHSCVSDQGQGGLRLAFARA